MKLFKGKSNKKPSTGVATVQTGNCACHPFGDLAGYSPLSNSSHRLYKSLREAVPIIDSAIMKTVRLTGGFTVETGNEQIDRRLKQFLDSVNVGGNQTGIESYISTYLEQLLTYGSAIGEIVVNKTGVVALYNAEVSSIIVKKSKSPVDLKFYFCGGHEEVPIKYPELINFSVLNPNPGEISGNSILKGLPFVSEILLKIFSTIGTNWERLGNLRFAVTYKPQAGSNDGVYAKERAMQMAQQWSDAMQSTENVKDFIAVGDVDIKVIGADNQILDSKVPVQQMMEQIIGKLGIPPFMLGLSWSTTERMSSQQADLLTSELEAYRRILTPVIMKIVGYWLRFNGCNLTAEVKWDDISLQDQVDMSRARLYNAQAAKLEKEAGL